MNVRELNAFLIENCTGDEEVKVMHDGRMSPVLRTGMVGAMTATVEAGGILVTDEMRANATHELWIMVEGWDRAQ